MIKIILIEIIFSMLTINSSIAGTLTIKSNPSDADVFVRASNKTNETRIGKTPLEMSLEDIVRNYAEDANVFVIDIRKQGFEKYRAVITKAGKVDIELEVTLDLILTNELMHSFDIFIWKIFDIQRLIRLQQYDTAIVKLNEELEKFPHISSISEFLGSTYYLKQDYSKALEYYRKAFAENPQNIDAYKMKIYLEKIFEEKAK
ncbi:MAG: tetratricopeptide repeat protein [Oligoflexia bacterium]|nr:tetratricopeptide repeat protein [Oligoflexia bacterium]